MWQGVQWKYWIAVFKVKVTAEVQTFNECLSGWYLNHWTFSVVYWQYQRLAVSRHTTGGMFVMQGSKHSFDWFKTLMTFMLVRFEHIAHCTTACLHLPPTTHHPFYWPALSFQVLPCLLGDEHTCCLLHWSHALLVMIWLSCLYQIYLSESLGQSCFAHSKCLSFFTSW